MRRRRWHGGYWVRREEKGEGGRGEEEQEERGEVGEGGRFTSDFKGDMPEGYQLVIIRGHEEG